MDIKKKLTDFLHIEDGSIAKKSMMLTGAVLTTSLMGEALIAKEVSCVCGELCPCRTIDMGNYTIYISCNV